MTEKKLDEHNNIDQISIDMGIENLKSVFENLVKEDVDKAVSLLNSDNLSFPTLFVLSPEIKSFNLNHNLNSRNKIALAMIDEVCEEKKVNLTVKQNVSGYIQRVYATLKWMLETGHNRDGLSNDYDGVLDKAAILITKVYNDRSFLPVIANMMFDRHKKGRFIHDLTWGFFECKDPNSLILLAERLRSNEPQDVNLSCKLLGFMPDVEPSHPDKESLYTTFLQWFEENALFLRYTGESFQQTHEPIPYEIDYESKYLYKVIPQQPQAVSVEGLSNTSNPHLERFKELDIDAKELLANFSYKLHNWDYHQWVQWISYPIDEQIRIANYGLGGIL